MTTDDLEKELRNLKVIHLTESEMAAYCDQELDQTSHARASAHLKDCFICRQQVMLLLEEGEALASGKSAAGGVSSGTGTLKQLGSLRGQAGSVANEETDGPGSPDGLVQSLRQVEENWQLYFSQGGFVYRQVEAEEQIWRWASNDGLHKVWALLERNGNISIHFSLRDTALAGTCLRVRLGDATEEIILRSASESEVYARFEAPKPCSPASVADLSLEVLCPGSY